ncbi:MAG: helix-turn-helix domain-containing protein [Paludibacter sp.]
MPAQIITTDDLREFKVELLDEIRVLISEQKNPVLKKWLKSLEVRRLLNISPGTLQTLRINGTLPYTKIGGTNYYNASDIDVLLSQNHKKKTR